MSLSLSVELYVTNTLQALHNSMKKRGVRFGLCVLIIVKIIPLSKKHNMLVIKIRVVQEFHMLILNKEAHPLLDIFKDIVISLDKVLFNRPKILLELFHG